MLWAALVLHCMHSYQRRKESFIRRTTFTFIHLKCTFFGSNEHIEWKTRLPDCWEIPELHYLPHFPCKLSMLSGNENTNILSSRRLFILMMQVRHWLPGDGEPFDIPFSSFSLSLISLSISLPFLLQHMHIHNNTMHRTGVDGIITNHPERLAEVLRESEFANRFRLATQDDSPWERIQSREDFAPSPAAPVTQPVSARWFTGFGDVVSSFAKYLRDFVYLRVPGYHNIS